MKFPLSEIQQAAGAVFGLVGPREMSLSYGNSASEHKAVREKTGLIDRSHQGKLRLKGKDRADFLNGMVTNEIKHLSPGTGLHIAITTDKARMLADSRVYCLSDALLLDLEPEVLQKIYKHLDKYVIAADVQIEDLSERWGLLSIYGPSSTSILTGLAGSSPLPEKEYAVAEVSVKDIPLILTRNEVTGEVGYDLYTAADKLETLWKQLTEAGSKHGMVPVGLEAFNSLRIEAGFPRYGIDMDESHFPMETGLEIRAISYTKGCYIGQETIARVDAQGHMNRHLMGLLLEGDSIPDKGQPILPGPGADAPADKPIGNVTSGVLSPTLGKGIALGYLKRNFLKEGTQVLINGQPAKVTPLPFYKRKSSAT